MMAENKLNDAVHFIGENDNMTATLDGSQAPSTGAIATAKELQASTGNYLRSFPLRFAILSFGCAFLRWTYPFVRSALLCVSTMLRTRLLTSARHRDPVRHLWRSFCVAPNAEPALAPAAPELRYPGAENAAYTSSLSLWRASDRPQQPIFRCVDASGMSTVSKDPGRALGAARSRALLTDMLKLRVLDDTFLAAQRQGRLSFYLACRGEEGAIVGATAALRADDVVFTQYREGAGVLLVRGVDYSEIADQCVGNVQGHGRGRQMPIHYGSAALHVQTVSSPLATQIAHAVGAARALRGSSRTAAVFFGDGAASEGDFAGALALAAVLRVPALFLCRNNGYAISTPVKQQYAGDGICARAVAAGVPALRVDGGDVWGVVQATQFARERAMREQCPVLIELMTYRGADHSTSDDSSRYRSGEEMASFDRDMCPVGRARAFLSDKGWWSAEEEEKFCGRERARVLKALQAAEKRPMPDAEDMFGDVYNEDIPSIAAQRRYLTEYLEGKETNAVQT